MQAHEKKACSTSHKTASYAQSHRLKDTFLVLGIAQTAAHILLLYSLPKN